MTDDELTRIQALASFDRYAGMPAEMRAECERVDGLQIELIASVQGALTETHSARRFLCAARARELLETVPDLVAHRNRIVARWLAEAALPVCCPMGPR